LVQLAPRELTELWQLHDARNGTPGDARKSPVGARREFATSSWAGGRSTGSAATPGRQKPASRADHAARLLLGQPSGWDVLSAEDHAMLCDLPAPHGPLFLWVEQQLHDHGPQPWGVMREGLRGHAAEELALRLAAAGNVIGAPEGEETADELRHLITRMQIDHLKAQETRAIDAAVGDPAALQRYRLLQARRLALEAALPKQS
jgi:DNA primase